MRHWVSTDDATGDVLSLLRSSNNDELVAVPGRTHREVSVDDQTNYVAKRWDGAAFVDRPVVPTIPPMSLPLATDRQILERIALALGLAR